MSQNLSTSAHPPVTNRLSVELFQRPELIPGFLANSIEQLGMTQQYVFPDVDQIVNTYLNRSGNFDVHMLMYCLFYSYGKYLILFGRHRQQDPALDESFTGTGHETYNYPPELFPANFVAYELGFKIPEVYDKFERGCYWEQKLPQRAQHPRHYLPSGISNEIIRFIFGSFNHALYNYYGFRAAAMMQRIELHSRLFNYETREEVPVPMEQLEKWFLEEHGYKDTLDLTRVYLRNQLL